MSFNIAELRATLPQEGRVCWIGVRPARDTPMIEADRVEVRPGQGLTGDRYSARSRVREVTLIQHEHLAVIGALLHGAPLAPAVLRRNLVISGVNLLALRDRSFWVGEVQLSGTGLAHPCSKMEQRLGPGGYNAMRGHGGITARVDAGGILKLGDRVRDGR
ncbi:MAG: MOSC domain-containing protein [Pseudomonadota bacterium]